MQRAIFTFIRRHGAARPAAFPRLWVSGLGSILLALLLSGARPALATTTNRIDFTYPDRQSLLADGWSFLATTAAGSPRDTEITNGPAVSFDQASHPETLRIPADSGDLWADANNSRNSLFRNLSSNWLSLRLDVSFAPTNDIQQVQLALYQDDDNYLEVGHAFNASLGGEFVSFVQEDGGAQASWSPRSLSRDGVTANRLWLRLDRDPVTEQVSGLFSLDGTNWTTLGSAWQTLTNAKLCIWVSDSQGRLPACDLRRLELVTSDTPLNPLLVAQPRHLVFNAVAGQSSTNLQQLRVVARRNLSSLTYAVSSDASWLLVNPVTTNTPGFCDVGVNPAGLAPGTYEGTLTLSAPGAVPTAATVSLIVNPAGRAQVATWRGATAGAMSVWVDDSELTGFEELRTNGFQGTYLLWGETSQRYPNASMSAVPPAFTEFYQAGMELGCHTVDHWYEKLLSDTALRFEIESNIAAVVAKTPQPPSTLISFAFPGGLAPIPYRVIASDYYLSIHGYNLNQLEDPDPYDFLFLKCYNSHEHAPYPPADLKPLVDAAIAQGKWFGMVLHAINDTDGAIAYAKGKDLWLAPGGAVTKYILQRQRTVISNYQETPGQIAFHYARLPLDASPLRSFETALLPQDQLTFQIDVTDTAAAYSVAVDGHPVPSSVRVAKGRRFVLFDTLATTNSHTAVLQALPNRPPAFASPTDQVVNQFATLVVTNSAIDPDQPFQSLTYALLNPPAGAQITADGVIQWTPGADQGPGSYILTTVVTDNGSPSLSATNTLTVLVQPQDWLVLPGLSNTTLAPGQTLLATNTATYTRSLSPWMTNTILFSYTNRDALLADGWNFFATTPGQGQRNTEVTNGAVVSYDQAAHPGTLRVPCDLGDLWANDNTSRNALFRNLPTNWVSIQLGLGFLPSQNVQQVQLALYEDDDNYLQAGLAFNSTSLGGLAATVVFETNAQPVNAFVNVYAVSNIALRLDREASNNVTALFSLAPSNWQALRTYRPAFANPRLSLWTGGAPVPWTNGLPVVELRQLEVVVSNAISPHLTYTLLNPPAGATIDASGVIQWTPAADQASGSYTFVTTVTDNPLGAAPISTTNSFTVTLPATSLSSYPAPLIHTLSRQPDGSFRIAGSGQPGWSYLLQASTNLRDWSTISTNTADTNGLVSFQNLDMLLYPSRYYRLITP